MARANVKILYVQNILECPDEFVCVHTCTSTLSHITPLYTTFYRIQSHMCQRTSDQILLHEIHGRYSTCGRYLRPIFIVYFHFRTQRDLYTQFYFVSERQAMKKCVVFYLFSVQYARTNTI